MTAISLIDSGAPAGPASPAARMPGSRAPLAIFAAAAAIGATVAYSPILGLICAVLVAVLLIALVRPQAAVAMFVGLTWASAPALLSHRGVPTVAAGIMPLLLLAVPVIELTRRGRPLRIDRPMCWLFVLLCVEIVSTIASAHQGVAAEKLQTFLLEGLVAYVLLVHAIDNYATLRRAVWTIVLVTSGIALLSAFQKFTGNYYHSFFGLAQVDPSFYYGFNHTARVTGPFADPNYYAQMLVATLPLAVMLLFGERSRWRRAALTVAIAVITFAIMLTASRGATLAVGLLLLYLTGRRYLKLRYITVGLPVMAAVLVLLVPQYGSRLTTLFGGEQATTTETALNQESDEESTAARLTEMHAAALVYTDHPLLGVGPGQFPAYYQAYASRVGREVHQVVRWGAQKGGTPERQAHDLFLNIAAELGTVGLIAFFGLLVAAIGGTLRMRRRARSWRRANLVRMADGFVAAILAYLAAGAFLTLAFERYFWLLIALSAAYVRIARAEIADH